MRNRLKMISVLFLLALVVRPVMAEETKAVKTMATILMTMEHFPTPADKTALKALADDKATTPQELVLVNAITNLQHSVSAADKPKVEALATDTAASAGVKTLGGIVAKFTHKVASDAEKAELKKLTQ
ncbi:MAG: hypothetical protein ABI051_09510 [Vicinamibacterales bacterium]